VEDRNGPDVVVTDKGSPDARERQLTGKIDGGTLDLRGDDELFVAPANDTILVRRRGYSRIFRRGTAAEFTQLVSVCGWER
jgi:hypothetical protein